MEIKMYTNLSGELQKSWKELWKHSPYANFTNSPEWFLAADETYTYKNKKIVALFNEGKLIGICALVKQIIYGIPVWTAPAKEFANNEPILIDYSNKKTVEAFIKGLETLSCVFLTNYKIDTLNYFLYKLSVSVFPYDINHYVDIVEKPYGNLSEHRIKKIKRQLAKDGLSIEFQSDVKEKISALEDVFIIERESSKLQKGKSVFDNALSRNFYKNLVKISPENLVISFVKIGKENAVYSINFRNKNAQIGSQKAHLYKFKQYSPGRLLVISLCEYARQQNELYFDFGRGEDEFKKSISTRSEKLYIICIAKNVFIRNYLEIIITFRELLYTRLVSHKWLYKTYRKFLKGENS